MLSRLGTVGSSSIYIRCLLSVRLTSICRLLSCYDLMMHDRLVSSTGHLPTPHTFWTDVLCCGILWSLRHLLVQLGATFPSRLGRLPDQLSTSCSPQTIFSVETLPSRPPFASSHSCSAFQFGATLVLAGESESFASVSI